MKRNYRIKGMHCQACAEKIQTRLEAIPGISEVQVKFDPPAAEFTSANPIKIDALNEIAGKIGKYQFIEEQLTSATKPPPEPVQENLFKTYYPIILILGYILLLCLGNQYYSGRLSLSKFMAEFMAGFFCPFPFLSFSIFRGLPMPSPDMIF